MKRIIYKYGNIISAFALFTVTLASNRSCPAIFHQPKMPESAKSLRKF